MIIGIIANITKASVFDVVSAFLLKLKAAGINYLLTKSLEEEKAKLKIKLEEKQKHLEHGRSAIILH